MNLNRVKIKPIFSENPEKNPEIQNKSSISEAIEKKSGNSKGAKWYVLDLFWIPGIFPISSENLVLILTLFKFTNFLSSNILASFSMCTKNDLRPKLCKRDKKNPNPLRSCKRNILQDCHQDYPVPLPVAHIWTSDQAGKKSFSVSFWKASLP